MLLVTLGVLMLAAIGALSLAAVVGRWQAPGFWAREAFLAED
jgi:hypothetical protein